MESLGANIQKGLRVDDGEQYFKEAAQPTATAWTERSWMSAAHHKTERQSNKKRRNLEKWQLQKHTEVYPKGGRSSKRRESSVNSGKYRANSRKPRHSTKEWVAVVLVVVVGLGRWPKYTHGCLTCVHMIFQTLQTPDGTSWVRGSRGDKGETERTEAEQKKVPSMLTSRCAGNAD